VLCIPSHRSWLKLAWWDQLSVRPYPKLSRSSKSPENRSYPMWRCDI
jgi:hypothetical protein